MAKTQEILIGRDDPALGVDVVTPLGDMWFESTDVAVAELATMFPYARLELERRGEVTAYEAGVAVIV